MTVFVVLSLWYIVGGTGGVRQVGTRIRQWFAPTQQELQQAALAPAPPPIPASIPVRSALRQKPLLTDPLPLGEQLLIVGVIVTVALGAMYFTGRGS